jgi:hypothetical protein
MQPMRHDSVRAADRTAEPSFEPPPQLGARAERRLTRRATDGWLAQGGATRLPSRTSAEIGPGGEFAENSLLLDLAHPWAVRIESAGAAIAQQFGLAAGDALDGAPGSFAARLLDACDLVRLTHTAVPVEGAFEGRRSACVLVRGVLMPLAGDDGRLGFVHAVISFKEMLGAQATAALYDELARALGDANRPAEPPAAA